MSKKTKFYLFNYFVELVVVMSGVMAGFALNNWAEGKKDERMAQQYMEGLVADAESDLLILAELDSVSEQKIEALTHLLILLRSNQVDEIDLINSYVQQMSDGIVFFHPAKTTYESMRQAGKVSSIQDWSLRSQLIQLYESDYSELHISEESYLTNVRNHVIPFVMENYESTEFAILYPENLFHYRFTNLVQQLIHDLSANLRYYRESIAKCSIIREELQKKLKKG